MSIVKKILRTKVQVLEKLNKIGKCFSQTVLFVVRKNQLLLKIKNSTILVIHLKWTDRAYEITRSRKYDGYQRALESMVFTFFDNKIGSEASVNEQLAEELQKPVIKKFVKSICQI